jgi:hypothetical protein
MGIGTWMFETNVGYGQNIANCVRNAMRECSCCVVLVTRESIVSLWILTELHNALNVGRPCIVVFDASDDLLLRLLRSLAFRDLSGMFDTLVQYDKQIVVGLRSAYASHPRHESRVDRYESQVHDFLASLPLYLNHLTQPAFAFPNLPQTWSGPLLLSDFGKIEELIYGLPRSIAT